VPDPRKLPRAHGLKVYPLLGTLPHLVKNRYRFLEWLTGVLQRSPTHTMSYKALGFGGGVITANPANIDHLLKTNFGNYPKGEATASMVEDLLGGGIFNSDGEQWLRQRKDASHEFSTR
jgi:cytochrome P450